MGAAPPDDDAIVDAFIRDERLPGDFADLATRLHRPLTQRIIDWAGDDRGEDDRGEDDRGAPLVVGVCGPQGSGKSTLVALLRHLLSARGRRVAVLSIDDLYLTHDQRQNLGQETHPLLATRGVPGTHDPDLGLAVLDSLSRPGLTPLPRFDKAVDDRAPSHDWPVFEGPADIVLLEGWCVGARPQPAEALAAPVNALEANEDSDGRWRRYANAALAGRYRALFDRLDRLILLTAPNFATVRLWRGQQEARLRDRLTAEGGGAARTLDADGLDRFVAHYQRLTEWIARDLPTVADITIALDSERRPRAAQPLISRAFFERSGSGSCEEKCAKTND